MPRVVRRAPLLERIKAYLNPWDFLLWLLEELNSNGWDNLQKEVAIPLGLGINIVFMVAQANSGGYRSVNDDDDVFGDSQRGYGAGWFTWFVSSYSVQRIHKADALICSRLLSPVCFYCSVSHHTFICQRFLHLLPEETLSTL
jgi:hypothetical protein